MDSNPFYDDLVEAWQIRYESMLKVKKSMTHILNKQKSFPDADKKKIVEAENRLCEITEFLEVNNDLIEAQKLIIEQLQTKQRQDEIDRRNSRTLIGDMPHSPQYYHDSIIEHMREEMAELRQLLTHQQAK